MPSTTKKQLLNWIDGVETSADSVFDHESPRAESGHVQVANSGLLDAVRAIQAMNRAHSNWVKATERDLRDEQIRNTLKNFANALEQEKSQIAETLSIDIGLPIRLALEQSLPAASLLIGDAIECFDQAVQKSNLRFPPTGNAAVFLGWTDPLLGFCRRVPLILASDNAVCVKPSSHAPRTVALVSELWIQSMEKAGLPLGLFSLLHGRGASGVGEAILEHPGFKTIYWIGRTDSAFAAFKTMLASVESFDKRFHFVGSGRNPALLFQGFDDAAQTRILDDLARTIVNPQSIGPYRPSRLFVQESIYKATLEKLAERLNGFKLGDPLDPATEIGPLPDRELRRFETQVKLALSETGRLVTGGETAGRFARPTLIRDLTNCSTLQGEELAGPWATIASFKYQHEALKYAGVSPLGLASYVLHPDQEKAQSIAMKLESSRVFWEGRPPWPQAMSKRARPVKSSAGSDDGTDAIFEFGQWRPTLF